MIHNSLFQECLAAVPEKRKVEIEFSFAIADRIDEILFSHNKELGDIILS